jgi:hypothetical protein
MYQTYTVVAKYIFSSILKLAMYPVKLPCFGWLKNDDEYSKAPFAPGFQTPLRKQV